MELFSRPIDIRPLQQQELDKYLLHLTDEDPMGLLLMKHLCELVESHEDWSEDDKLLIYESIELMDTAHGHDNRGNGDAYITHPLRVAITLLANHAPPRLIAAGLLHDTVEDNPEAVTRYLLTEMASSPDEELTSIANQSIPVGASKGRRIEHALSLMRIFPIYTPVAPLVDGVTNRAYPPHINAMTNPGDRTKAKHRHRAKQIIKHIEQSEGEAILKFADTYDNIRGLERHEAFTDQHDELRNAENAHRLYKLVVKYMLMIDTWEDQDDRPAVISREYIDICRQRLITIISSEPLRRPPTTLGSHAITGVSTLAA